MRARNIILLVCVAGAATSANAQWSRIGGVPAGESYAVTFSRDTVFAGIGPVVYVSADLGTSWKATPALADSLEAISALLNTPSGLVAGTLSSGVFRLRDGIQWEPASGGLTGAGASSISALVMRDSMLYAGTSGAGVFRTPVSILNGWTPFRDSLPWNLAWTIFSLTNINDTLWAGGGANASVYRNLPHEGDWHEIPFAVFSPLGTSFLAAIRYGGGIHAIGSQGFHRSNDGGGTWTLFDPGLGYLSTGGFAAAPGGLFAFASKTGVTGLYRLQADDSTWTQISIDPGPSYALVRVGNALFVSKYDGLWKFDLSTLDVADRSPTHNPQGIALFQNYPNPFNPVTTIRYTIGGETGGGSGGTSWGANGGSNARSRGEVPVRLAVYDLLGREVAVLVNEHKAPGTYSVSFTARNQASGVYLYRITSGPSTTVRTMHLTR